MLNFVTALIIDCRMIVVYVWIHKRTQLVHGMQLPVPCTKHNTQCHYEVNRSTVKVTCFYKV